MAGRDADVVPTVTDAGAAAAEAPAPSPSAASGDATAGVERAAPDQSHVETKSDVDQIVDRFLEKHPAKQDNFDDPIAPKPAPSDGADPAGQSRDSQAAPPEPDDPTKPAPEQPGEELPDGRPADWLTKEEMAALGPKAKARIESLWRENRDYVSFADQAEPFLKPIRDAGLPIEDVQTACALAQAINTQNWEPFLSGIMPYVQIARQALGLELPEDLRKRVDDGDMSEDAAADLTRARFVAAKAETRAKQFEQGYTRQVEHTRSVEAETASNAIVSAINGWEEQQRVRDPDYRRLRPLILDKMIAFASRNGQPPDPEAGVRLAEWAKAEVMKSLPSNGSTPRATAPSPSVNGSAKAPLRAEPKDVYSHVFQRLGIS